MRNVYVVLFGILISLSSLCSAQQSSTGSPNVMPSVLVNPGQTSPGQSESVSSVDSSAGMNGRAQIAFVPPVLELTIDSTKWLQTKIKLLNRGNAPLRLSAIKPSCGCASATVMSNPVKPMELADVLVRINTSALKDSLSMIEFNVESNATTPSFVYRVYVRNPKAAGAAMQDQQSQPSAPVNADKPKN